LRILVVEQCGGSIPQCGSFQKLVDAAFECEKCLNRFAKRRIVRARVVQEGGAIGAAAFERGVNEIGDLPIVATHPGISELSA
jgi:hypothetical protein